MKVYLIVTRLCIYVFINNVKISSCNCWSLIYLSKEMYIQILCSFFMGYLSSCYLVVRDSCIFMLSHGQYGGLQIFSHSLGTGFSFS